MRSTRVKLALVVATSIFLLTGCAKMDAAAIIGDVEIPLSTVQTSVDDVIRERAEVETTSADLPSGEALVTSQAQFHITIVLLDELAKQFGIEVTESDVDAQRAAILEQVGGDEALAEALAGAVIAQADFDKYIIASQIYERLGQILIGQGIAEDEIASAQQALIVGKASELSVMLNPRYGVWDENTASVQSGGDSNGAVTGQD